MASLLARLRHHFAALRPNHLPVAYKLGLSISLLIVGCVALLGLVIINQQSRLLLEHMDSFGQAMVEQLADTSKELVLADDSLALSALIINLTGSPRVMGAAVYHRDGHPLAHSGILPEHLKQQMASEPSSQIATYTGNIHFQDLHLGTAVVTLTMAQQHIALRQAMTAIALSTLFVSLLAGIAAFFMGKHLTRPIDHLMKATKAIGAGDYGYRLKSRRRDEIGQLMAAFNQMAHGLQEKSQVEGALSRYVSAGVAKQIMNNLGQLQLGGHQVEASVLFADIVGFTSLSEQLEPNQVAQLLNEYFSYMSRLAHCYRGNIDKFLGDGVMVVFGVIEEDPDHRFHAIACGVLLQRLVERLNRIREASGQLPVRFRVGVNSGLMLAGNMGADDRMQYTVVGDAVNLAARLMASGEPGQVIIPEALLDVDPDLANCLHLHPHGCLSLRGKETPVRTCMVQDLGEQYRPLMERHIQSLIGEGNPS